MAGQPAASVTSACQARQWLPPGLAAPPPPAKRAAEGTAAAGDASAAAVNSGLRLLLQEHGLQAAEALASSPLPPAGECASHTETLSTVAFAVGALGEEELPEDLLDVVWECGCLAWVRAKGVKGLIRDQQASRSTHVRANQIRALIRLALPPPTITLQRSSLVARADDARRHLWGPLADTAR